MVQADAPMYFAASRVPRTRSVMVMLLISPFPRLPQATPLLPPLQFEAPELEIDVPHITKFFQYLPQSPRAHVVPNPIDSQRRHFLTASKPVGRFSLLRFAGPALAI